MVGGRNSANTRHLAQLSSRYTETYHITGANEIDTAKVRGHKVVGISAGASTPDSLVDEVAAKLEEIAGGEG